MSLEKPNYESKGEEEKGDGDSKEINKQDQANTADDKGEVNSDVHVQQLNGQEPMTGHSKGELSDENHDEESELKQEADINSQTTSESVESTHSVEDDGSTLKERRKENELDGVGDRKTAESANQEESEEGPTVTASSS